MGHMIIANIMAETTDLHKVWFIVSPQNPFKPSKGLLHEFDRYDMVRAAIHDNYKLEVSDVEFHLPKPSYTIHTLVHLSEKYPDKKFKVILGGDNLEGFERMQLSELKDHPNVKMVEAPLLDISATFIRNCIRKGQSVRYLVPDPVEEMIRGKQFYR